MSLSRREFLNAGALAAAGSVLVRPGARGSELANALGEPSRAAPSKPVVIASANGIRGVAKAYDLMTTQHADPLDAIIAGVNIQELDPEDHGVGLGGLPNEEGVVQLDASVMHGPTKRAGAVGALEDIATASLVAKAVMDYTDHIFLVGAGARQFAIEMGFQPQNLLTEESRQMWLRWKANLNPNDNWLDHSDDVHVEGLLRGPQGWTHGTINMNAVNAAGDIGSCTSTSGLAWKIPGRVGDTPIIGAGQYCDNAVGAAGSVGRGEANIKVCGAFLAVELMRQGKDPEAALMTVIERVIAMSEPRLLDDRGRPRFELNYFALSKDGRFSGAAAYDGWKYAVADADGARLLPCAYMYKASERPSSGMTGTLPKR